MKMLEFFYLALFVSARLNVNLYFEISREIVGPRISLPWLIIHHFVQIFLKLETIVFYLGWITDDCKCLVRERLKVAQNPFQSFLWGQPQTKLISDLDKTKSFNGSSLHHSDSFDQVVLVAQGCRKLSSCRPTLLVVEALINVACVTCVAIIIMF